MGVGAKASGSLISIWKEEVLSVDSVMQTQRVLAIKVLGASDGFVWVVANVYGPNVEADRPEFLELLADFKLQISVGCSMGLRGDFHMVRCP